MNAIYHRVFFEDIPIAIDRAVGGYVDVGKGVFVLVAGKEGGGIRTGRAFARCFVDGTRLLGDFVCPRGCLGFGSGGKRGGEGCEEEGEKEEAHG